MMTASEFVAVQGATPKMHVREFPVSGTAKAKPTDSPPSRVLSPPEDQPGTSRQRRCVMRGVEMLRPKAQTRRTRSFHGMVLYYA